MPESSSSSRESAWRDERCWRRMMQPLTRGAGLHVYFKHQAGLPLYLDKSIRSEFWHFQLPLTKIYCLFVALQTEFLLQRFSQNHVYLWLHCSSCLCLGCKPHSSVYFLSFQILLAPSILSSLSSKKTSSYSYLFLNPKLSKLTMP